MGCSDPVATLLAFHANGTLSLEDLGRVESHLAVCDDCRALHGFARLAREEMADCALDPGEHVQAQVLSEYVEDRGALDEETKRWVSSHLERCEVCASVVPVLRGLSEGPGGHASLPESPAAMARLWELLKGTILRPVPAMAYLALVLVGVAWLARTGGLGRSAGETATLLPSPVPVHGEIAMRGEEATSPPLRLETSPGVPVRLALHTDLDPEEIAPGAPRLRLVLRQGGSVLWSAPVAAGAIPPDGVLEMTLLPDRLPRGIPLDLMLERDGGQEQPPLFYQRLLLAGPDR